ncbi:hypothetical protein L4X63_02170 [Geomonas sp. Red32]|uniref:hypothetical protein n=1 Tax=Geomonas sp. Red32 TaxID=2912856 RepID=UPI00202CC4DA|nr:hypothetical protein [Geomonas sp. Red32]MCM0080385.1 hypothetical protein [Geomonas sp. Red32]
MKSMKLVVSLAALFVMALATVASAEGMPRLLPGSDLAVVLGYKAWVADWKDSDEAANNTQYSSGTEVINIPVLSVKYKDFFVGGSYLPETTFKLADNAGGTPFVFNAKRSEWDASAGYYVVPSVAVTLGYKSITQEFPNSKYEFGGPTLGLSGKADIAYGLGLYSNAGFGYLSAERKADGLKGHSNYFLGETGLSYKPATLPLSLQVGYRIQYVDTKYDANNTGATENTDITRGLVAGINLIF